MLRSNANSRFYRSTPASDALAAFGIVARQHGRFYTADHRMTRIEATHPLWNSTHAPASCSVLLGREIRPSCVSHPRAITCAVRSPSYWASTRSQGRSPAGCTPTRSSRPSIDRDWPDRSPVGLRSDWPATEASSGFGRGSVRPKSHRGFGRANVARDGRTSGERDDPDGDPEEGRGID
jgi:hypothetical protein